MFRVQENDDGSTVVFCSNTGKQIFILHADHQQRIPERINVRRPINVVGPSRHSGPLSYQTLNLETAQGYTSDQDKDSNDSFSNSKDAFPTSFDDASEDYFNNSVRGEEFARCLNLVPKKVFENETLNELLEEFPLRLHARNRACRPKDDSFEEQKYQKLPDDLPLTSNLGVRYLKLNKNRNFLTKQKLSISLKKCDAFCRFPFNSPNPVECNFPKLRCREKKSYPTLTSKVFKQEGTHVYTYGRRQRLERMKTLKTGLNKRSRRLFRMCNKKNCSVVLNRLEEAEIQHWLSKRRKPIVITIDDSDDEIPLSLPLPNSLTIQVSVPSVAAANTYLNRVSLVQSEPNKLTNSFKIATPLYQHEKSTKNKNVIPNKNSANTVLYSLLSTSTSTGLVHLPKKPIKHFNLNSSFKGSNNMRDQMLAKSKGCQDCYVPLKDVLKCLHKFKNEYYVKFTKTRVPFYDDYLASVSLVKRLQMNVKPEKPIHFSNGLVISAVTPENAGTKAASTLFLAPQNKIKNKELPTPSKSRDLVPDSKSRAFVPTSQLAPPHKPRTENSNIEGLKIISCIDLTGDSSPEKDTNPLPRVPQQFNFRCYKCDDCNKIFSNKFSCSTAAVTVENHVYKHMKNVHSVDKPEAYLSTYLDTLQNCCIIEAFPGYKSELKKKLFL